jgi:predicted nucleic acid-binding protein
VIVLDTNVLSEVLRSSPSARVRKWMSDQHPANLFTTAISEAEMLYGIAVMATGQRRAALQRAIAAIFVEDFAGRVLPFDSMAAASYAEIAAERRKSGQPVAAFDAQIAAIARSRGASVATRNASDFAGCGIPIVDPWTS